MFLIGIKWFSMVIEEEVKEVKMVFMVELE
jgi:hypothetical protein